MGLVATAIHYAHEKGVFHRDLKPANILFDDKGQPRVSDFGLAKFFENDLEDPTAKSQAKYVKTHGTLTNYGAIMGTPSYMAPEQFKVIPAPVTRQTDIWAIGVTLFEILTGERPFSADDQGSYAQSVCNHIPMPPASVVETLDKGLNSIVLKCLEKNPDKRYQTAQEVAFELHVWQNGGIPTACQVTCLHRIWHGIRLRLVDPKTIPYALGLAIFAITLFLSLGDLNRKTDEETENKETMSRERSELTTGPKRTDEEAEYKETMSRFRGELTAGRSVDLINYDMKSLQTRWKINSGQIRKLTARHGKIQLWSFSPSLFEILDDPGIDSYALNVEMCQDQQYDQFGIPPHAVVGIYFGHSTYLTEQGQQHFFGKVEFADLGLNATTRGKLAGRPSSRFDLGLQFYGTAINQPVRGVTGGFKSIYYFAPDPDPSPAPGPWRNIRIEVRKGLVQAKWQNQTKAIEANLEQEKMLPGLIEKYPDMKDVKLTPLVSKSLGIYLFSCSVRINRFDVEPLKDQD
jgi:serine/threonine protein kinase